MLGFPLDVRCVCVFGTRSIVIHFFSEWDPVWRRSSHSEDWSPLGFFFSRTGRDIVFIFILFYFLCDFFFLFLLFCISRDAILVGDVTIYNIIVTTSFEVFDHVTLRCSAGQQPEALGPPGQCHLSR